MLETTDLILKSGSESDWESLYDCFWSKSEVFTYMFQLPCTTSDAARKKTAAYAGMHKEVPTEFFIYLKETGQAIGIAGIKCLSPGLYTITDIAMGPAFWGHGYGKQILQALTSFGWELGAERISYNCFQENAASRALALSCGYQYIGAKETELKRDSKPFFLDYFEITK